MNNKTIAAISTAQGEGGIGIIRISGENAVWIADKVFKSVNDKKLAEMKGYSAAFGHIVKDGEIVDECVATVFRSPKSYTGEDVVELSCHGGLFITREVLRIVLDEGAVPAEAGEFTKRAFLNGKIDLTEAEAVIDIISAKSKTAARAALCAREGALWNKITTIKSKLITTAAHLSAWADYPEEDIEEVTIDKLSKTFFEAKAELNKLLDTYDKGQTVKEGIDTVIAGKPNAGKSTLMNLLSGHNRSIVTEIPGTTRDIIEETVLVGDVILRLSDTAGIRDTEDTVEKIGVDLAKQRLSNCGLVLAVFDSSETLDQNDMDLIDSVKDAETIAVINKDDLESEIDENIIKSKINRVVKISAKTGEGYEQLEKMITDIAGTDSFNPSEGILSNERQRQAVLGARDSLNDAIDALNIGMTFDAIEVALEDTIASILELTGERVSEVVVDNVFHNFCVGK
ncbi:MAG: tRNA uridine-5-carboxymethylaminomethyl(34) synthesis GTPase MnmE [Ruminococcus sp.]|nr:tRNA uridine-5-carboxymethylaminomethyl(34) synthesis GTPase MnmE [Ruminococcus sp.]